MSYSRYQDGRCLLCCLGESMEGSLRSDLRWYLSRRCSGQISCLQRISWYVLSANFGREPRDYLPALSED